MALLTANFVPPPVERDACQANYLIILSPATSTVEEQVYIML